MSEVCEELVAFGIAGVAIRWHFGCFVVGRVMRVGGWGGVVSLPGFGGLIVVVWCGALDLWVVIVHSACGVVIVLVSWLMFLMIGKFAWVFHAVAFLASSISCSLSAG